MTLLQAASCHVLLSLIKIYLYNENLLLPPNTAEIDEGVWAPGVPCAAGTSGHGEAVKKMNKVYFLVL